MGVDAAVGTSLNTWDVIAVGAGDRCGFGPVQLEHPCVVGASLCGKHIPVW